MAQAGAESLRRHRPFLLFLAARSVAIAGYAITAVALPLLVFQLSGSAFLTASVAAIEVVPYLLFGLFAGALADRMDRRRIMVVCQLVAALALASVPAAAALQLLTTGQVLAVAAVLHSAFVWFDAACFGALPAIVGKQRLVSANTAVFTTTSVIDVSFPAVGGLLIAAIGPANAVGADALACLAVATILAALPMHRVNAQPDSTRDASPVVRRTLRDIREGLDFLWHNRMIRALSLFGFGQSLTAGAVMGLLIVYADQVMGLSGADGDVAWAYVAVAGGGLAASLMLPRLSVRAPVGWITIGALVVNAVAVIALGLSARVAATPLLVLWSASSVLAIINGITTRQLLTPEALQSRVNTTARMIAWGGTPIGALIAGAVAQILDVRTAYLVMSLGVTASAVLAACSPLRRRDAMAEALAAAAD